MTQTVRSVKVFFLEERIQIAECGFRIAESYEKNRGSPEGPKEPLAFGSFEERPAERDLRTGLRPRGNR